MSASSSLRSGTRAPALFGWVFLGIGVGFGLWRGVPLVVGPLRALSWTPVPAEVLRAELVVHTDADGDSTWEATATYRWAWDGRSYQGDRVAFGGGADNVGGFQARLGRRLEAAVASGQPITVRVDPADPSQAVVDGSFRPELLALVALLSTSFSLAGAGVIALGRRAREVALRRGDALLDAPWRAEPGWRTPRLVEDVRGHLVVKLGVALVFAIGAAFPVLLWATDPEAGGGAAVAATLGGAVLVGIGIAVPRALRRAARTPAVLTLDPFPGALAGDVGGTVDLPVPFDPSGTVEVRLTCLRQRRGRGDDADTTDASWQDVHVGPGTPGPDGGTRVAFVFRLPAGLPASDLDAGDGHVWRVGVRAPGARRDVTWDVPVLPGDARSGVVPGTQVDTGDGLPAPATLRRDGDVVELVFPAGRAAGNGAVLVAVGLLFAGLPGVVVASGERGFVLVFLSLFVIVGLAIVAGGLWWAGNRLDVRIGPAEAEVRWSWLGVPVRSRRVARADVVGVGWKQGATATNGRENRVRYALVLRRRDGGHVVIGDGLDGEGSARRAAAAVSVAAGIEVVDG